MVLGGCSRAGIINTVRSLQKVSDIDKVHAVLIDPEYVAPMHCTGWKAINRFNQEMAERFILNSVGTTYAFN